VSSYTEEQEPEQGKKSAILTVCSSDGMSSVMERDSVTKFVTSGLKVAKRENFNLFFTPNSK
jgi:hypothetical protein